MISFLRKGKPKVLTPDLPRNFVRTTEELLEGKELAAV
jgi:hypothetical protein